MKKEFLNQVEAVKAALGSDWGSRDAGNMPITKGQKLTFIDGEGSMESVTREIQGADVTFAVFHTKEGFDVPFGQIFRRNNGLGLTGKTRDDMLNEFVQRIDGKYSVVVEDVVKQESSFGEGKMTYLRFKKQS